MDAQDMIGCEGIGYIDTGYDDDCFGDILNILDFPVVETLDGDGLVEDWAAKLGPIPSEVFREILPPVAHIGVGSFNDGGGGSSSGGSTINESKPQERKMYRVPRSFEAPSPDSVLERSTSGSTRKRISFVTGISIPVRPRTKRSKSQSTLSPWLKSTPMILPKKGKKKGRNLVGHQSLNEIKKCSHCEITKTPQWREGPMGPKTLCNACGVRYRSGRLFPEYRPAASPTFIPSVHSNSHRKVIEMRQKGGGGGGAMEDDYFRKKVLTSNSNFVNLSSC